MNTALPTHHAIHRRDRVMSLLRKHAGRILSAFFLTAMTAGLLFHFALLNYFDQSLFAYWAFQDVLLAPLRWPGALLLALVAVIIGVQLTLLRGASRQPHLSRYPLLSGLGALLLMCAFVLLVYAIAYHEAGKTWYQSHNDVRIELVNGQGAINGREISVSSGFRFLLADEAGFSNRGTKRFIAIPATQVLDIIRCAPPNGNEEYGNACEQADRFTGNSGSDPVRPDASGQVVVPIQEQAPEPYQRNRLIKEPDF